MVLTIVISCSDIMQLDFEPRVTAWGCFSPEWLQMPLQGLILLSVRENPH